MDLCIRANSHQIASRSIHPEPPSHNDSCEELSRDNRDLRTRLQHIISPFLSEQSISNSKDQDALIHDTRHKIAQREYELSLRSAERGSL
ncbi:hypothetical protein SeMB42_g02246 [Synchytrium endobioticum]|uniref:Uncharacterized protein n=1 Tax=Synchytrium endobioticum TaxID=286115 RepID=A0A507D5L0_9FUNG|nr:hypothetical protein SeLEV6574_g03041 [Synchytrium endobioticum]TPX50456.1 hypothetical protein SeMB42_g02246 [Synchytrium endobioticum]